jgi:cellulose synthase operon protein C
MRASTCVLDRDSITDTLLSFAGAKDPETKNVWGGVVADTASVRGHWGNDRSGFYASTGYQWITGDNVEKNTRIDGNAGTYWKVLTRKEGSLTLGLNLSAMHYDKNLRFFTLGQGGYFSPQQYFLFNVPVRWVGNYKRRLQYTIAASLGSQHFVEDSSPFFPTQPSRQLLCPSCYYAGQASNGANYNIEAKIAYQLSPNLFVGAWANANNARDYSSQSAGVFVKYSFDARPLVQDNVVPSVPDWKGQQPFGLF